MQASTDTAAHEAVTGESSPASAAWPAPTCGEDDRLTPEDARIGYQCDECADRAEGRGGYE